MKKQITLICGLLLAASVFAEPELTEVEQLEQRIAVLEAQTQTLRKFKVSGYIQAQYQWGEGDARLRVGLPNPDTKESFSRFGVRRGRIKFTYDATPLTSGVFQLDITERGVSFKDAYFNVKDPWINTMQLRVGIFDRPFGNEIGYSSSRRESPERSLVFQTLFPDERDLGTMVILQPAKTSPWNFIKLEAGLFAGNGIRQSPSNHRDFIGRLSANQKYADFEIGGGVSYYNGSVYQSSDKVFTMDGNAFKLNQDSINIGKFAKREYVGIDFQASVLTAAGMTMFRAEYLFGQQPGTNASSNSPNWTALPTNQDTYIRPFSGWYVILVQDLGELPFSAVLKYDVYNPNTKVEGDDIGLTNSGTSRTDVTTSTFGFGALWRISPALRLQAFYEIPQNETSKNVSGFEKDRKDSFFTLRLQYKF
ncbi:MAG: OprO/OprP family phosphate-selective porin [Bacteroidales bacterium]|nr:OprO/OprP family phosphate-selective porin [Bacteroidales bacterium]